MRRVCVGIVLAGTLLGSAGCGGDPAPSRELTAEEEEQFERERQKDRQGERREGESREVQ